MKVTMFKSKLHQMVVTEANLMYEGSITIDRSLLEKANILPGEQVQVVNLNNGTRLITYTIAGEPGNGAIELNGPAARMAAIGDKIIIISYGNYDNEEAKALEPIVVFVDPQNQPVDISNT